MTIEFKVPCDVKETAGPAEPALTILQHCRAGS